MPSINYPNNPTIGQTATYSNGNIVIWSGSAWKIYNNNLIYGTSSIDFGFTASGQGDIATASILSTGVKSFSTIVVNSLTSSNHESIEDALIEEIKYEILDKIEDYGFTIYAYAPNGTWGQYIVEYKIIN